MDQLTGIIVKIYKDGEEIRRYESTSNLRDKWVDDQDDA
jgi:hypothetical protein